MNAFISLRAVALVVLSTGALAACDPAEPEATKIYGQDSKTFPAFYIEGYKYNSIFNYKSVKATHKQVLTLQSMPSLSSLSTDEFIEKFDALDKESYNIALKACPSNAPNITANEFYEEASTDTSMTIVYSCGAGRSRQGEDGFLGVESYLESLK